MNAELDIWILLFVAAAAQGFFLFFLLLSNQKKKGNQNGYLASLIFFFTLTLSYYVTFWTKVNPMLPGVFDIILYFTLLFGPLIVGYISKVEKGKLPKYWLWHFTPFLLVTVTFTLLSSNVITLSREQGSTLQSYVAYGQNIQLMVYSIWAIVLSHNAKSSAWARKIAYAFAGYALCFLAYFIMVWTGALQLQYDYMVSLGMTGFIYFLGYHGFRSPETLYPKAFTLKYEKSSLGEGALAAVEKKLDDLMTADKLYTKGDLKLQDLSDMMGISANDISQTVNVRKKMKFTDYLNDLRVAEAVELMHSEKYKSDKLLAVAIDSGFNNKTSFLNAFKKKHGISPSQYRRQIHLQAS